MRISTSQFQQRGIDELLRQQTAVAKTQAQLASGLRLQTAQDDPVAAATALGLEHADAQFARYQLQIDTARQRLGLEETVLGQAGGLLGRVRELAIQLNTATQSPETRQIIAGELRQLREQLTALANSDDGQGHYLFAGSQDSFSPFGFTAGVATYAGDQQQRLMQVTNSRSVADADPGSEVFLRLRDGNGVFSVAAHGANTGSAALGTTRVPDPAAWDGGAYTLSFNGGNYEIRDTANALVTSGAYSAGQSIAFRGIELVFEGLPADGDRFAIAASRQQDVFAQIEDLARLAELPLDTAAQRAQRQTALHQALGALGQAELHVSEVRAGVGNRLAVLDDAESQNAAQREPVQAALSELRDLDYAEAATRLSRQLTALQAAQQTLVRVQGLSLFDYL